MSNETKMTLTFETGEVVLIRKDKITRMAAAAGTEDIDETIRLLEIGREVERQRAEAKSEPELDLSRWLHADGTARIRDGRAVRELRRNNLADHDRHALVGVVVTAFVGTWTADGKFREYEDGPLDLVPAYTHRYVISGTAFTVELWQTGEGDDARTHMVCTAIDARVRGVRYERVDKDNGFRASNGWRVMSKLELNVDYPCRTIYLRGAWRKMDVVEATCPGHHAHAMAIALHEALAAWDAELAAPEPEKSTETVNPLARSE